MRSLNSLAGLLAGGLLLLATLPAMAHQGMLHIGVQIEDDEAQTRRVWEPFINALGAALPEYQLELFTLERDTIPSLAESGELDFMITDPALYVELEVRYGATRMATRVFGYEQKLVSLSGATIIAPTGRATRIETVADLRGRRLIAMDDDSFFGWTVAELLLRNEGVGIQRLESLSFADGDAWRVIESLRAGSQDAGVLPAGMLEEFITTGRVAPEEFMPVGERLISQFPFAVSSRLLPEWTFARLRHTPDLLARKVAVELFRLTVGLDEPRRTLGWTTPRDYHPIHAMLRELGQPPYEGLEQQTLGQAMRDNRRLFVAVAVVVLLLLGGGLVMFNTNRRLKLSRAQLSEENAIRRQAEEALGRYGEELEERIQSRTAELEYQAHYDALTGLPNRNLLNQKLEALLLTSNKEAQQFAVMQVGFEHLDEINVSLGRNFGDQLLQQAADLIQKTLGRETLVARFGDATFVALVGNIDDFRAQALAHELYEALDRIFYIDGQPTHLKAQIGIAIYPAHGTGGESLLRNADIAMQAVRSAKSEYALYDSSLNRNGLRDLKLLGDLRTALYSDNQLSLAYQPKVDLREGRLVGVEALLRWDHPELGRVSPELFISLAERTGLIRSVTLWVMNAVFDQCQRWKQMGLPIVTAVNLSAWNLQDRNLLDQIRELMDAWQVDPSLLEMEITEGAMMSNPDRVLGILKSIKELGIRLSIDDFGTGFSSLSYLKRFPVDEVKIDKSFVLDITSDEEDLAIVRATVELTHSLGMSVIAEGVNDERAVELLREMGCDMGQGYYIGRPMTATELLKWNVETSWGHELFRHTERQRNHPAHRAND